MRHWLPAVLWSFTLRIQYLTTKVYKLNEKQMETTELYCNLREFAGVEDGSINNESSSPDVCENSLSKFITRVMQSSSAF